MVKEKIFKTALGISALLGALQVYAQSSSDGFTIYNYINNDPHAPPQSIQLLTLHAPSHTLPIIIPSTNNHPPVKVTDQCSYPDSSQDGCLYGLTSRDGSSIAGLIMSPQDHMQIMNLDVNPRYELYLQQNGVNVPLKAGMNLNGQKLMIFAPPGKLQTTDRELMSRKVDEKSTAPVKLKENKDVDKLQDLSIAKDKS